MIDYTAPSAADMQRLKVELGYTGEQMAQLASVAGGQQWRKYTGGSDPRKVNIHILFFMAARLTLPPETLRLVAHRMLAMGAEFDADALLELPGPRD